MLRIQFNCVLGDVQNVDNLKLSWQNADQFISSSSRIVILKTIQRFSGC
jgi:hypothetical protein